MLNDRMESGFHKGWLAASLLSTLIVLALTHIPLEAMPKVLQRHLLDKVEHVVAYGLIAALFMLSLPNPARFGPLLAGLVILAGIGIIDETTQPLVNRCSSIADYVADLTGIVLAGAVLLVGRWLRVDTVARP